MNSRQWEALCPRRRERGFSGRRENIAGYGQGGIGIASYRTIP